MLRAQKMIQVLQMQKKNLGHEGVSYDQGSFAAGVVPSFQFSTEQITCSEGQKMIQVLQMQ
jgi:hypothetical protein